MSELKELLERAVDGVAADSRRLEVGALRAAAGRVRRRRRAAALAGTSLAVAAVVAVPLAVGGAGPRSVAPPQGSSSAWTASPSATVTASKPMEVLRSLLPKGIGQVEPVLSKSPPKEMAAAQFAAQQSGTGLAGTYAVRRGSKVGLITVQVEQLSTPHVKSGAACEPDRLPVLAHDCFQKDLPGGSLLFSVEEDDDVNSSLYGSPELTVPANGALVLARVYYPNGRTVTIVASAGVRGPTGYGPILPAPPLTQQQVVALVEQPLWRTQN
ncbi:hypothetical protein [Streptacidiphilus carbonis]|uniref:hypothetical protein n=1 Tax=Streptacidiphilus carbonis TaxID=105422 RepID=UPI0005AB3578|nr:hypothetical protein [Streptacidiphilus carbonis]